MVELLKELYNETYSCVLADEVQSEYLEILSGVRQRLYCCTRRPTPF